MIEWKPIETAPQHGKFLVFCTGYNQPVVGFRCKGNIMSAAGAGVLNGATHWAEFNLPEPSTAPTLVQRYRANEGFGEIFLALDEELARMRRSIEELQVRAEGRG